MVRDTLHLVLLVGCLARCGGDCGRSHPTPPTVYAALFDQNGRPVCNRGTIEARQAAPRWYPLWDFPGIAEMLPNGTINLTGSASCNLYFSSGGEQDSPNSCLEIPLRWRVAVDGCDPAEGTWTREQNNAHGQSDINIYVIVRLRCTRTIPPGADASTDAPDASADAPRE